MRILKQQFIAPIAVVLIGGFIFAASPGAATAQGVKQRVLQQQEQMRKRKILEEQQQLQATSKPERPAQRSLLGDDQSKNQGRHDEASAIYRNLRVEQNMSHQAALAALKNSGFPTDRIVEIP